MHISPFVPSVASGRIPKSLKMTPWPPHRALEKTQLFFLFFFYLKYIKPLWKVCTFHHLSHQLFSKLYLKVWKWSTDHHPSTLKILPFFSIVCFCFKYIKPLWKVCTFHHLCHRLFSERYLKVWKWSSDHHPVPFKKTPLFIYFLFKVHQTILKSMHISPFVPSVIFGSITRSLKMVHSPPPLRLWKKLHF